MKLTNILTCLALAATSLTLAFATHAAGVPGQGTWESTLLGRDINRNPVAATSAAVVYLYDTTLNVTWLRDADFYGVPFEDWTAADESAANLVTGSGGAAVSDWRLPAMLVGNPAGPIGTISYDGSSPQGYNVPGSSSEMAHLFYVTLGNISSRNTNGTTRPSGFGLSNTGSFLNLRSYPYWMGTSRGIILGGADVYWEFDTRDGLQWYSHENAVIQAMAVRSGDVSTGILYEHPPITTSGTAYPSASNIPNGSAYEERIWDRFQFATTQTIREIQWRGACKDRAPVNFTVKIYLYPHQGGQSDYTHPPLASFQTNGNAGQAPAGTFGGTKMYDYRFTLPTAFSAIGNVAYWLQIIATQDGLPDWKWAQGNGVGFTDSTHYSRVGLVSNDSAYQTFGGDCCFALLDVATTPDATIVTARTPTTGGTVTGAGTYAQGSSVTVTAAPAMTYTFNGWKEGTTVVSTALSYTFTATAYRSLTASFTAASGGPYDIVTRSFPTIGGLTKGTGTFNLGASVTVTAEAGEGFAFASWTENDQVVSTAFDYTFSVSTHRNLEANFTTTDSAHSILKLKAQPFGSGTFVGGGAYVGYSGTRMLRAVPASGYTFTSWSNGSSVVSTSAAYSFNVVGNGTLYANFSPVPGITSSVGGGILITWPETASGWLLQESADLSPAGWTNSMLPITISGGQKRVPIENPNGRRFFRLTKP